MENAVFVFRSPVGEGVRFSRTAEVESGQKKIPPFLGGFFKIGIDLLLRALGQLPSAQPGLTTLFGMGRGGPRRYRHHKVNAELRMMNCIIRTLQYFMIMNYVF